MDQALIRTRLRDELRDRGYEVASDSLGLKKELYIVGPDDKARALFEFKSSLSEAFDTMYQGRWLDTLPPRVAVLPVSEIENPETEILAQAGLKTLFCEAGEQIEFLDLDALLEEIL